MTDMSKAASTGLENNPDTTLAKKFEIFEKLSQVVDLTETSDKDPDVVIIPEDDGSTLENTLAPTIPAIPSTFIVNMQGLSTPSTPSAPSAPSASCLNNQLSPDNKYNSILKPDVLKSIMALNSPGYKSTEPYLMKLADGTLIKVNFGTLKKQVPRKKKRIRKKKPKEPKEEITEPQDKKKRIRKPHPFKNKLCPGERPCGERLATYKNWDELANLAVQCVICKRWHCPLCLQTKLKPSATKKVLLKHLEISHWNLRVRLVINDEEYFTVSCRLTHGNYKTRHLHCPCGHLFQNDNISGRFLLHRRSQCPLTKHLHPDKDLRRLPRKRKLESLCTVSHLPHDRHQSTFDSIEEVMNSLTECASCKKYHCIVCRPSRYAPATYCAIIKHVKFHLKLRVSTLRGPFFLGCYLKHGDIIRRHFHCLCGQIIKSNLKTFKIHLNKCQHVLNPTGNRENYTKMILYPKGSHGDLNPFVTPIQIRSMIPRNSLPVYGKVGEKIPPPALSTGVFENLRELCSIIKRCYTCCTRYHCPLCPGNLYQPSSRLQLAKHLLKLHYKYRIKLPSGQYTFPCSLVHGKSNSRHYHCVCGHTPIVKSRFLTHTRICKHSKTRIVNPIIEENYLIPDVNNFQNYPQQTSYSDIMAINDVQEIFDGSSSDEEGEIIKDVVLQVSVISCPSTEFDHVYCKKEGFWEETVQHHVEARNKYLETNDEHHDNSFFPIEENEQMIAGETFESEYKNMATRRSIINTSQSAAPNAIFNPFDMLVSMVTQCTQCCSLFHCPFCPVFQFKPTTRKNTIKHLKTHWMSRVIMIDGTFAVQCYHEHHLSLLSHYHCMCGDVIEASANPFYSHVRKCDYMVALTEECKQGIQEVNQPIQSKSALVKNSTSKLDKVVVQLENLINSPSSIMGKQKSQKRKSKKSRSTSESDREEVLENIQTETQYLHKKQRQDFNVYDVLQTIMDGSSDNNCVEMPVPQSVEETELATQNLVMESDGFHQVLHHDGLIYDIIMPPNVVIDVDSIRSLLPSDGSFVVVNSEIDNSQ